VNAVELSGIFKAFGLRRALDGLDLAVGAGEVFALLGPNGAGKTTAVRVLLGLVRPDAGTAAVLGRDPSREPRRVRASVGVLLEHDGLYDRLSALENLDYHGRLHGMPADRRRRRMTALFERFGLAGRQDEHVGAWSKGMRQKLALARALMHEPLVLLLDEPFTGLDPLAAVDLRSSLVALARTEGVTVLLTTHDLGHVEKACDRVAVIREGKVVAEGAPGSLSGDGDRVSVLVRGRGLSADVLADLVADGALEAFVMEGGGARLTCTRAQRPEIGVALVSRGVRVEELHTVASLEQAVVALLSEAPAGVTGSGSGPRG
jgi:ABC-2 type transport system ATP-binding protein